MDQIAGAGTVLAHGIPMLFMGEEAGESTQFGQNWDDRLPLAAYATDPGRNKVRLVAADVRYPSR
jgi:1,4-alpha-glucan branching enzyme